MFRLMAEEVLPSIKCYLNELKINLPTLKLEDVNQFGLYLEFSINLDLFYHHLRW